MSVFNRLALKNLKLNKKMAVITIVQIILSVILISTFISLYASWRKSGIYYTKQAEGNYHCSCLNLSMDDVGKIRNNRKVESIFLTKNIGAAEINSKNKNVSNAFIRAYPQNSLENLAVNVTEGRLPKNENEILIPQSFRKISREKINVGDSITLNIGQIEYMSDHESAGYSRSAYESNANVVDTKAKTYKIVGLTDSISSVNSWIESPVSDSFYFTEKDENFAPPIFITYIDQSALDGEVNAYIRFTKKALNEALNNSASDNIRDNYELIYSVRDSLGWACGMAQNYNLIQLECPHNPNSSFFVIDIVLTILLGITMLASVLLIKNSFAFSIVEKLKLYGMLKSVGATRKQIRKSVLCEAYILALIGIPLGILLSFLTTFGLIWIGNKYMELGYSYNGIFLAPYKLSFSFSILAVIASVLLGIATIHLAASISAKKASKISAINLMRNSAGIEIEPKKIKSSRFAKRSFYIGTLIAYKIFKRDKKRYRAVVSTIAVSIATVISVSVVLNIEEVFLGGREPYHPEGYSFSLMTRSNCGGYEVTDETYEKYVETTKLDDVKKCIILRSPEFASGNVKFNAEVEKILDRAYRGRGAEKTLEICAVGERAYGEYIESLGLNYDYIKDKAILIDGGFVYSEAGRARELKSSFDIQRGEKITTEQLSYRNGAGELVSGENKEFEIGEVTNKAPFGIFASHNYIDFTSESSGLASSYKCLLIISDELYNKFFPGDKHCDITYETNNAEKLRRDIENILIDESNYSLEDPGRDRRNRSDLLRLFKIFFYGCLIVVSMIALASIFSAITANMQLRRREYAMLQSVGMSPRELRLVVNLEAVFIAIKSLVFGLVISIPIYIVITKLIMPDSFNYYFNGYEYVGATNYFDFLKTSVAVSICISIFVLFAILLSIAKYSMYKINKQNIMEVLKNQNI